MSTRYTDLTYLERLYKGDRSRIEHWIRLYLEEAPSAFTKLSDCMEKGDGEGLVAAAHDLRPYAHYLGIPRLLDLLVGIGHRLRTEGMAAIAGPVREVMALSAGADAELRAVIAQGVNTAKPV